MNECTISLGAMNRGVEGTDDVEEEAYEKR